MEIKIGTKEGVTVVEMCGRLDGSTSPQAQEQLLPLADSKCCMVLDLKECDYISSAGLRVLLMIAKQMTARGAECALANICDEVKDVMEMTGFSDFFKSFDDVAAACKTVRKKEEL